MGKPHDSYRVDYEILGALGLNDGIKIKFTPSEIKPLVEYPR